LIEGVDNRLRQWAASVLDGRGLEAEVLLTAPGEAGPTPRVAIFLLDLLPATPAAAGRRPPLQITLRYLVAVAAARVEDAHGALGALVFAAMEQPDMEVELAPLSAEIWSALGASPRPSFLLRVPARVERAEPHVGRVTRQAEVHFASTAELRGRLIGPGEIPLAAAEVEIPTLRLVTRTDLRGYFRFPAVPAEPARRQITVRSKGVEKVVTVEREAADGEPVVIHFDVT
jgi:hypothetical protein